MSAELAHLIGKAAEIIHDGNMINVRIAGVDVTISSSVDGDSGVLIAVSVDAQRILPELRKRSGASSVMVSASKDVHMVMDLGPIRKFAYSLQRNPSSREERGFGTVQATQETISRRLIDLLNQLETFE